MPDIENQAMTLVGDGPDIPALSKAYTQTLADLGFFLEGCQDSYRWRRNIWTGKARDLRKHGGDAFPWDGAADTEAHVISQRINTYIALFMQALNRANIRANPTELSDIRRAKTVSCFLKWMISSYIPQFKRQMELNGNYLLEKGMMITYVGWEKENRTYKQKITLAQLGNLSKQLVQLVMEGENDEELGALLQSQFGQMKAGKVKKILNDLRGKGEAEFPVVRQSVNRPCVEALAADCDFFFPAYTSDPQQAPYCFRRVYMTAQELRNKVGTEGWDDDWVEYIIKHCKGVRSTLFVNQLTQLSEDATTAANMDLYEIIYAYQRLTDEEDNSEGIYCTIFHEKYSQEAGGVPAYAKHELLNGYDDYPVVVTKVSEDDKRLYEVLTIPEQLRSSQFQVKVERDSRIDRNSLATLPAVMHPLGTPPPQMGPGITIPYKRQGEIQFGPTPAYNPGSVEMEQTQISEADNIMGLALENPLSTQRQQYLITKFLEHVRDVIKLAFKCYQRFGPDSVFFRVTGVPDPQQFMKGSPDENYDVVIDYDVLNSDPETLEKRLNAFASLLQFDKSGLIDVNSFLSVAATMVDPLMADTFLRPVQEAQQQVVKDVTDDLSKIYAGIEVGARPNGAQTALQVIQQYASQPDISQRLQQDKIFAERLQKYAEQYQMMLVQAQNAQIGKLGTAPAQMGGMTTQGMNQ